MVQRLSNLSNQTCWNCSSTAQDEKFEDNVSVLSYLTGEVIVVLSLISAFASLIGSAGNALVLLAVSKYENLRTIPDLFIASLALSDLTVCVLFLPMSIYHFQHPDAKDENVSFYLAKIFFGHLFMVASATNMFAVTIDRIFALRFPFKYIAKMTKMGALTEIAIVWVISLTFGALYACKILSSIYVAFYSTVLLFGTIAMYIYIFIVAKRQENRIQDITMVSEGSSVEKKVAKTILTVVGVYTVCWLPMLLFPVIVNPSTKPEQFGKGYSWVQTLLACNSAVNPYIYCVRSQKYRRAFAEILKINPRALIATSPSQVPGNYK